MNYHKYIQELASDIISENEIDNYDNAIHETADSECIYTKKCLDILVNTRNDDAYLEHGMEIDTTKGAATIYTQLAFWAIYQDLTEEIGKQVEDAQ